MDKTYKTVLRVDLCTAPIDWELICEKCGVTVIGYKECNKNFFHRLDERWLILHSIYCHSCVNTIKVKYPTLKNVTRNASDEERVRFCSDCGCLAEGKEELNLTFYYTRQPLKWESRCKSCDLNRQQRIRHFKKLHKK